MGGVACKTSGDWLYCAVGMGTWCLRAILIIRCRTYFEYLIFRHHCASEKFQSQNFPKLWYQSKMAMVILLQIA